MIVALLNQKGGVGKTTLATHIAGELAMRGQHVVLLDADPQGSALDWTQRRSQQGLPRLFSADRKSTRLNSSHLVISYAVFCLKKKKKAPIRHSTIHAPIECAP